jgi:hypothetical protein
MPGHKGLGLEACARAKTGRAFPFHDTSAFMSLGHRKYVFEQWFRQKGFIGEQSAPSKLQKAASAVGNL